MPVATSEDANWSEPLVVWRESHLYGAWQHGLMRSNRNLAKSSLSCKVTLWYQLMTCELSCSTDIIWSVHLKYKGLYLTLFTIQHYLISQWHSHLHKYFLAYRNQLKWEKGWPGATTLHTLKHTLRHVHRQGREWWVEGTALWIHSSRVWCQKPCRVTPQERVGWQRWRTGSLSILSNFLFFFFFKS